TVSGEQHKIGFPMARCLSIGRVSRPFGHGNPAFDEVCRASAGPSAEAAFALAAWQIETPTIVLGAGDLRVNEPIDAPVPDDFATALAAKPPGHLLRGPSSAQTVEHGAAQDGSRSRRDPAQRHAFVCCC